MWLSGERLIKKRSNPTIFLQFCQFRRGGKPKTDIWLHGEDGYRAALSRRRSWVRSPLESFKITISTEQ